MIKEQKNQSKKYQLLIAIDFSQLLKKTRQQPNSDKIFYSIQNQKSLPDFSQR